MEEVIKMKVKYPHVIVSLTGEDGNVFSAMGRVSNAMRRAGASGEEIKAYNAEIFKARSYDDALGITMRWVNWS